MRDGDEDEQDPGQEDEPEQQTVTPVEKTVTTYKTAVVGTPEKPKHPITTDGDTLH